MESTFVRCVALCRHRRATVGHERLTGEVAGVVGGEEGDNGCDVVLRVAKAAERNTVNNLLV